MKSLRLLIAAALLAAGGCADGSSPSEPAASFAPGEVVLQVSVGGGFVPVAVAVTELPTVSVFGDGRVITTGPVPAIYPGPALPNVQVQHISQADVAKLTKLAVDAGVGMDRDLGMPNVADAPTTQITVRTAAGLQRTSAPALGIGSTEELSEPQRAAREQLQRLVEDLTDLPKTLGASAIDRPAAYVPTALTVVAVPWQPTDDPMLKDPPAVAWPGPALPGDPVGDHPDVRCVTATGAQVTEILAAAKSANARTPWTAGGSSWSVSFRPLLPHESSCADLG
ncbi:hypothetical protein Drose_05150 [Dactylosporangium roseum]|uniref:Uncharacterized protein n=1 Tax=Dactylosporangium roseum TaxID=47989 RepID=A0ABY5Z9J2_9ACTN|nr:hypothetical protein [Dactylosporangium roseum]UWZ37663.1 hypothetical protein Drose_05150 [Dactylosporangium roseum]